MKLREYYPQTYKIQPLRDEYLNVQESVSNYVQLSRICGDNKILYFVGGLRCGVGFDENRIDFNPHLNPPG